MDMYPSYNLIILIDDDLVQNHVNKIIIRQYLRPHPANTISFSNPLNGLGYIKEMNTQEGERVLLLVDINMPELSGWQLLEKLSQLEESTLKHLSIYMLSSSIDSADKEKAAGNPIVDGYIVKPLSDHLAKVFKTQ